MHVREKEKHREKELVGKMEGGGGFISDSNRADRQHPGGQQAPSREQPKQTKGLLKLGELP